MSSRDQEKYIDPEMLKKILMGGKDDDEFMMGDIGTISMLQNHIYFYADIVPSSVLKLNNVLMQLMREQLGEAASRDKPVEPIHIHINSPGGIVSAGFIGYDTIIEIGKRVPLYTHVEGNCSSAGTLLSIAGTKRFITPYSTMLIHELSTFIGGKLSEISQDYRNSILIENKIEEIYLRHSKISKEDLQDLLKRDVLLSAEDALEKGLVDEIKTVVF